MKKILALLLVLTAAICTAFAFSACSLDDLIKKPESGTDGTADDNLKDNGGTSDNKDTPPPPDGGTFYRVTVTGIDDLFYEQPEKLYEAGTEVEVKLDVITDMSLYVFVNDKRVAQSHYDSDYWGYKFTMPEEDITIFITANEYHGVEICDFSEPFYWVNYLKKDEVVKIKCKTGYIGVSPDTPSDVKYTTDKTEIENICAVFNCKLKPCSNPQIEGGYYVVYTFYTDGDREYELEISNGYAVKTSFSTIDWFEIVDFKFPEI